MLTTKQLAERKHYIGASDVAAICGIDPFRTPYDVWASKTCRVDDFAGNDATEAGDRLETAIIKWAADKLHASSIETSVFIRHPQIEFIAANLDAVFGLRTCRVNVDAKASGIVSPLRYENWTDDDFPESYQVQLQAQLACDPNLDHAYLAALCPPKGFCLYHVERDQAIIDAILEKQIEFWEKHVLTDTPPEDSLPSPETLKRMRRIAHKETSIDSELVHAWRDAIARNRDAEAEAERAKLAVVAALGDAEVGDFGSGQVTFFETTKKEHVVKATSFRTLRMKGFK